MDLGQLLLSSLSSDQRVRENATRALETAAKENLGVYLSLLSQEVADTTKDSSIRQAAGVAFKNSLVSRDAAIRQERGSNWLQIEAALRAQIKDRLICTLGARDVRAGTAAGQAVAAIAFVELPLEGWPELMGILLENSSNANDGMRRCTIETIGFICEETEPEVLMSRSNQILTAVVRCLSRDEGSAAVREAAAKALNNSLAFIKDNFTREAERNIIMQVVCEAASAKEEPVVVAAMECLVGIVQYYYPLLPAYMNAIGQVTLPAISHEDEAIGLQAIEFWSTVCDIERDLNETQSDGAGPESDWSSFNGCNQAAPFLVPSLLGQLCHEEEEDVDEWNRAMASATCLSLLAEVIGDEILTKTTKIAGKDVLMSYVESNVLNSDWKKREAAVMAYGSVMDGTSSSLMRNYVPPMIPILTRLMTDNSVAVRDTTAWALGRVLDFFPELIEEDQLKPIAASLIEGLKDAPRVAVNCCWSLMSMSVHFGDDAAGREAESGAPLSLFLGPIASALFVCSQRSDADQSSLRSAAYQSLASVVLYAPGDTLVAIQQLQSVIITKLVESQSMANMIVGVEDRMRYSDLQSYYCTVLQNCIKKLGRPAEGESINQIMFAIQSIFDNARAGKGSATELEDVFLLTGSLIAELEGDFAPFTEPFLPFLCMAIGAHAESNLCTVALGVVGDLARALGSVIQPYCDQLMSLLLAALQSGVLSREVKPHVISAIGDIALAVNGAFLPYLNPTMVLLGQASTISLVNEDDYDEIDFVCSLRESLLEAFTGIVQGFKDDPHALMNLSPHLPQLFIFLGIIAEDENRTDNLARIGLGLLGDISDAYRSSIEVKHLLRESKWLPYFVSHPLGPGAACSDSTQQMSKWVHNVIHWVLQHSVINPMVSFCRFLNKSCKLA